MPRDYSWSMALGNDVPDEGLLSVMRHTHADPMYCVCGATWGHHGSGRFGAYSGCPTFQYNHDDPRNKYKRDFSGHTDFGG